MPDPTSHSRPLISIVIPAFDEEENIPVLYRQLVTVAEAEPVDWEFIFIDDGSTDGTYAVLEALHVRDPRVKALSFTRNFGSHVGTAAGLQLASGDAAIIMAADLQDPPQVLHEFLDRWRKGYKIVWGVRTIRDDPLGKRIFAALFYRLIRRVALPQYPKKGTGGFCLIDRDVVEAFSSFKERNRVTFGLISWSGFSQTEVPYERPQRHSGTSKWSFGRQVKAAIDTLLAFSYAPVRLISLLGIIVSLFSFLWGFVVIFKRIFGGIQVVGYSALIVAVLFLGGMQLIVLGILGEYLWRILDEVRGRPLFVLRTQLGFSNMQTAAEPDVKAAAHAFSTESQSISGRMQDES
ncbi:MAG: glycosyltransferase family 2 protein [Chloroflexi bacterium]|nr:glycosyltransferase family 2 protein [Chloroflexota bacterium]